MRRNQAFRRADQFHQVIKDGGGFDQPLAVFQFQHRHAADRIDFQPAVGVGGDREIFAAMRNIEQGHRHGDATRIGRQVATDQFQHAKGSAYGCSVAASP